MWKGNFNCFLSNRPENLLVIAHFAHNVCLNVSCNNAVMSIGNKRNSFYVKLEFRNSTSKLRYFAFSLYCLSLSLPLLLDKNPSQVVYKKSPLQLGWTVWRIWLPDNLSLWCHNKSGTEYFCYRTICVMYRSRYNDYPMVWRTDELWLIPGRGNRFVSSPKQIWVWHVNSPLLILYW